MIVLPRIARHSASELLKAHLSHGLAEIASSMPDLTPTITYTPVGGQRIETHQLEQLRTDILALAHEHGMPNRIIEPSVFEGRAARLLREALPMSANEAAHEEVWSYLTCCWLLDVAVWRFGVDADKRRFIGNVNRNTFRRLWWRAETLGPDIDLTKLGEDELVNIMERPTIASDRRLARTVALEFLARVDEGAAASRMQLMREAMKRLLRLTPLMAFQALADHELRAVVEQCFGAAAEGLSGGESSGAGRHRQVVGHDASPGARELPPVSPGVMVIERMTITDDDSPSTASGEANPDFDIAAGSALSIARRVGRVTNTSLRELVPITSGEAREVLRSLVQDGLLASRGVRRGTYYVLNDSAGAVDRAWPPVTTTVVDQLEDEEPDDSEDQDDEASENDVDDVEERTSGQASTLPPYVAFGETLPPIQDTPLTALVANIVRIVEAEGPVLGHRLHDAYRIAYGGQRVGKEIARQLNRGIQLAVERGQIVADNPLGQTGVKPKTFRLPSQPEVVRRELGPRTLGMVPPAELASHLAEFAENGDYSDEELFREVLGALGLKRLTEPARAALSEAMLSVSVADRVESER